MSWSNHKVVKAKKIAQWGSFIPRGEQIDPVSDAESMGRLVVGTGATIMAKLVDNPDGYTHLVQVDFCGPRFEGSASIIRVDYYFAKVENRKAIE